MFPRSWSFGFKLNKQDRSSSKAASPKSTSEPGIQGSSLTGPDSKRRKMQLSEEEQRSNARWSCLPSHLALFILELTYWTKANSASFRLVCQGWRRDHDTLLPILKKLKSLSLGDKTVGERFPNIETLHLHSSLRLGDSTLAAIEGLNYLRYISFNGESVNVASEAYFQKSVSITSVKLIGGATVPCLTALAKVTSLTKLDMSWCESLEDNGLSHLDSLTSLTYLDMRYCKKVTDAGIGSLSLLTGLKYLNLESCEKVTDEGLHSLSPLTSLTSLNFCGDYCFEFRGLQISDAGMQTMSLFTNLVNLKLEKGIHITDTGIACLHSLSLLKSLNLNDCRSITSVGLKTISMLTRLEVLSLTSCKKITVEGLSFLSGLVSITSLNLNECCGVLNNKGLFELSNLVSLKTLCLSRCGFDEDNQVTDVGISSLTTLTSLTSLYLGYSQCITGNGLMALPTVSHIEDVDSNSGSKDTDDFFPTLPSLTYLNLSGCVTITNSGLRTIARIQSLKHLNLSGCKLITDNGILFLKPLFSLNFLDIQDTRISQKGVKALAVSMGRSCTHTNLNFPLVCVDALNTLFYCQNFFELDDFAFAPVSLIS